MTSPSFVLLGLPDEPIEVSVDELSPEVDFSTSKCGGRCKPPPPFSPSDVVNTAKCGICGGGGGEVGATSTDPSSSSMKLICQIYCPLSGSRFHRTLYLFACVNRNCWNRPGSWIALRAQAVCQEAEAVEETNGAKKDDLFELNDEWDDDEDDWGAGEVIKDVVHVNTQRSNGSAAAESSRSSVCPPLYTANTLKMTGESSDEEESMSNESSGRNSVSGDVEDAMAVDENVLLDDDVEESKKMLEEMRKGSAASLSVTSAASSSRSPTSFLCFDPFYVACVEEEAEIRSALDVKVEKLLTEYKKREGDPEDEQFLDQLRDGCRLDSGKKGGAAGGKKSAGGGSAAGGQLEKYEKGMPKHGDLIFQVCLGRRVQLNLVSPLFDQTFIITSYHLPLSISWRSYPLSPHKSCDTRGRAPRCSCRRSLAPVTSKLVTAAAPKGSLRCNCSQPCSTFSSVTAVVVTPRAPETPFSTIP